MGWGREDRKEQGPLESYAESPMPHEAKRSKSVCPDVHMVKNVIVYFNKPRATEHPTYLLVFTNFLIFVFMLYMLKAIQKEKSTVAIKFAGTFMIYVLFSFVCNNDKII